MMNFESFQNYFKVKDCSLREEVSIGRHKREADRINHPFKSEEELLGNKRCI
jgi:hypothetical protein